MNSRRVTLRVHARSCFPFLRLTGAGELASLFEARRTVRFMAHSERAVSIRPVDVRFAEMDAGFDFDFGLLLALGFGLTVLAVLSTSRASECPGTSAEYVTGGDPPGGTLQMAAILVSNGRRSCWASRCLSAPPSGRRVRRQDHDDRQRFSIAAPPGGNRGAK